MTIEPPDASGTRWLDADEQRAWRAWLFSALLLQDRLDRELQHATGISHAYYEILVALSETQLMNIRNFGQKSVDEVRDKLTSLGLSLKDSVPGFDGAHFYGGYDDETV